ncbi:MAG: tetratricopeptide repeat protein [Gemmataceae bacterium]|nr:tetratricopeptide repeat protein [Gemmataceae bacterium]
MPARNNLGRTLYDLGELDRAFAEYRQAIRLDGKEARPRFHLGNALADRGDLAKAVAEHREAKP